MATRYASWAMDAMEKDDWGSALAALERASDFADVSSDISYLLALAWHHENKPRGMVLGALEKSLETDIWNLCRSESARFLKIENLIAIKAYSPALDELAKAGKDLREAELSLLALGLQAPGEFLRYMAESLDRYPRDNGPPRVFFGYLRARESGGESRPAGDPEEYSGEVNPGKDDFGILELILRRLPVLLLNDPELAWMAAPYIRDKDEARRLVSAYRAIHTPVPDSIPAALQLGVIDEETAVEELFDARSLSLTGIISGFLPWSAVERLPDSAILDMALLSEVWKLLRSENAKLIFRRNLSAYTGVIKEDRDKDGIPETSAEYYMGMMISSSYDEKQDRVPDLSVHFEAGNPVSANVIMPPEGRGTNPAESSTLQFGTPELVLQWERYPAVLEAELEGIKFVPRPLDFYYSPVLFDELWGSGVLFPRRDPLNPPITRRVLIARALRAERPSREFAGGREVVELNQGIPVRAREYMVRQNTGEEFLVSETEFVRGRPLLQRVDLDLDGHMETVRHFRQPGRTAEPENLLDYDSDIDYTVIVE